MEKQLGWASKLGGLESLGISEAGQTVLARLMESLIQLQLAGSVAQGGRGVRKGTMLSVVLMPGISVSPSMSLVPFRLLPWCWSLETVRLSR